MIVGLLNLYGAPAIQQLVLRALENSGLLAATDVLYYAHVAVPHARSAKVQEERDLFRFAKQYTTAHVWSFNVKDFSKGTPAELDWCAYELFFLVENWHQAVAALNAGYDSYGVNLHSAPEPYYEAYCFWMSGSGMNASTLQQPYCAFQSFTNHYSQRFPPELYHDCDWSQTAPFSSRRLQQRLLQLPEAQRVLGTLFLLLFYNKNHYEPIAYHQPIRPYVILDGPEVGALIVGAPGLGRIDCVLREAPNTLSEYWPSLGWAADFNTCQQVGKAQADLIYTTSERVEQWIPHLAGQGVLVFRGSYHGRLPSQRVGEFTLVARELQPLLFNS
jgi:hypothetical protein